MLYHKKKSSESLQIHDFTLGHTLCVMLLCHAFCVILFVSCFLCHFLGHNFCLMLFVSCFFVSWFLFHAFCVMLLCYDFCVMLFMSYFLCHAIVSCFLCNAYWLSLSLSLSLDKLDVWWLAYCTIYIL